MIRLVIPRRPPSQNDFTGKGTRWAYHAIRSLWEEEVAALAKPWMRAEGPRTVTVLRVYGGRERTFDWANGIGGLKPVIDALVTAGLLEDDDLVHLPKLDYEQVKAWKDQKAPATIIESTGATP